MAETAAILSPEKTVLLPVLEAGCPMVDMSPADTLIALKEKHPDATVVTYVNSSAEVKALSDYCCTSANAINVVKSLDPAVPIIFFPDQYLGAYVASVTGRELIMHPGYCPTHVKLLPEDIEKMRQAHPGAKVMVHPECPPAITSIADEVLSTSGMVRFARETSAKEIIVGTEQDMAHRLRKENPDKTFYVASENLICPNMKKITLDELCWSLEDMKHVITVPEPIRVKALKAVERMVQISG